MRLSELTTLRVGGPARRMLEPAERVDLIGQTLDTWASDEEWLVLGGGSNLVIAEEGFPGTVIRVRTRGIEQREQGDRTILRVEAGETWDDVVVHALENDLVGIEALSGIPGSAGAAPMQNIGAYGQELSDVLVGIEFLDYESGELESLAAAELDLGYRTSSLKRGRRGLVVAIELSLEKSRLGAPVAYAQLASALGVELGERVPARDVRESVLALRASKGMVLSPDDPDSVSAGSFFTNPIVPARFAHTLPPDAPRWAVPDDGPTPLVKLSAAWLIEQAGVRRGFALPGSRAAISGKHTLAIVNRGGATGDEVAELARFVQLRVASDFGITLVPEPVLVGLEL